MARRRPGALTAVAAALSLGVLAAGCGQAGHEPATPVVSTASAAPSTAEDPVLAAAATRYHDYVVAEVAALQTATRSFTDAVRAGDIAQAKALYAPARVHYEDIESVVDNLGDLDDDIDARADAAGAAAHWIGFHRIEKALWADGSLAGMGPFANELDLDVFALRARVALVTFEPADLADRASDLLVGVSTTKITGEEDRYAHTDLWDIAANIDGAHTVFALLKPALLARDPGLVGRLDARFAAVLAGLDRYRAGPGYVSWSSVPPSELRALSDAVDALAEPLSQVGVALAGPPQAAD
ncbi:MAG TPA: iron uptake system protein EfeO [Pseudonocardia sp.]